MVKMNYYKWAFHCTICILIIRIVIFFSTINIDPFVQIDERFAMGINYFNKFSMGLFIASVIFLIVGFVKDQKPNYQFWIATILSIGYLLNLAFGQFSVTYYVLF